MKTKRCYMAKKSIFRSLGFADWFVRLDDLKIRGFEKDVVCENAVTGVHGSCLLHDKRKLICDFLSEAMRARGMIVLVKSN